MFKNDFEGYSQEEVLNAYQATDAERANVDTIIYAHYGYEDYEGDSHVIFIGKDGLLYEVKASHCSCYGLEEQWSPETTSYDYFMELLDRGVEVDPDLLVALSTYRIAYK